MHSALPTCQPPFMVRSLQLVEVRPYAEEEEEEEAQVEIIAPQIFIELAHQTMYLMVVLSVV